MFTIFLIVVNFSYVEESYKCIGEFTNNDDIKNIKEAYFIHRDYRPWVTIWSDIDGHIHLEVPGYSVEAYYLNGTGPQYILHKSTNKFYSGRFSLLSKNIEFKTSFGDIFKGQCEVID